MNAHKIQTSSNQNSLNQTKTAQSNPPTGKKVHKKETALDSTHRRGGLRCSKCGHKLGEAFQLKPIHSDKAERTFSNPHGILFQVSTASVPLNTEESLEISHEFSWFPSYGWRYSICRNCQEHLGWRFETTTDTQPTSFYGLITAKIRVVDEGPP